MINISKPRKLCLDNMQIVDIQNKLCIGCMEIHDIKKIRVEDENIYKGVNVKYFANYEYCDKIGVYWAEDQIIDDNFNAMRKAYEKICKKKV